MMFDVDFKDKQALILRRYKKDIYFHTIKEFSPTNNLINLDKQIKQLESNTLAFLDSFPAFNAILWGARGCGKSSTARFVLKKFLDSRKEFRVIQMSGDDIKLLPFLVDYLRDLKEFKFVIFFDDLSIKLESSAYKSIKSLLEGSLEAFADNIKIYATSNVRRILENPNDESDSAKIEENLSFGDRFPLQIAFYSLGAREFLGIVYEKLKENNLINCTLDEFLELDSFASFRNNAFNFAAILGNRSPRSANDFVKSLMLESR